MLADYVKQSPFTLVTKVCLIDDHPGLYVYRQGNHPTLTVILKNDILEMQYIDCICNKILYTRRALLSDHSGFEIFIADFDASLYLLYRRMDWPEFETQINM